MSAGNRPYISEIVKKIREVQDIQQEVLARKSLIHRTTISAIENGVKECSDEQWLDIKTAMGIEHLPIDENERDDFRDMLYGWYDVISERDWEKAKEMQKYLSVITLVPQDVELYSLFVLFECRVQIAHNELETAEKTLDEFARKLDELDHNVLYHYYYNRGTFNFMKDSIENSLDFYLKTSKLAKRDYENNATLHYAISRCHERLGYYAKSADLLEVAILQNHTGRGGVLEFYLYNSLGKNYAVTGHLHRAREILKKALDLAEKLYEKNPNPETKAQIGLVHLNYGLIYRKEKKWRRAIHCQDEALQYFERGTNDALTAIYQKLRCSMEIRRYPAYKDLLEEAIELSKGNEPYTVLFEMFKCMANINKDSARHMETKILPYLIDKTYMYTAFECCEFLRDYHVKHGRVPNAREHEVLMQLNIIRSRIHEGGIM